MKRPDDKMILLSQITTLIDRISEWQHKRESSGMLQRVNAALNALTDLESHLCILIEKEKTPSSTSPDVATEVEQQVREFLQSASIKHIHAPERHGVLLFTRYNRQARQLSPQAYQYIADAVKEATGARSIFLTDEEAMDVVGMLHVPDLVPPHQDAAAGEVLSKRVKEQ